MQENKGFIRLKDILKTRIPVSRSSWLNGISEGRYPPGVKLSVKTIAWRLCDIDRLEQLLGEGQDWRDQVVR